MGYSQAMVRWKNSEKNINYKLWVWKRLVGINSCSESTRFLRRQATKAEYGDYMEKEDGPWVKKSTQQEQNPMVMHYVPPVLQNVWMNEWMYVRNILKYPYSPVCCSIVHIIVFYQKRDSNS